MLAERNDPCPCGSGRKYKKCCMPDAVTTRIRAAGQAVSGRPPAAAGQADPYSTLRVIEARLATRLTRFAHDRFGEDAHLRALEEFDPEDEELEIDDDELQLFLPWFLFTWRDASPAASPPRRADSPPPRAAARTGAAAPTIAEAYLEARGNRAEAAHRAFIEKTGAQPFSFHEVIHSEPGKGLWLRDVLRGSELEVTERTASRSAGRGDILFARVVPFETCAMLVGLGATPLPPIEKIPVLELRKELRSAHGDISIDLLHAQSVALRLLYLEARDRLWNPPPLEIHNTDGDPILFHTLTYEVESAEAAFRALHPLSGRATENELLDGAEFDKDGRLHRVDFPWTKRGNRAHKQMHNTILGYLEITGRALTVEVNSARRARRIQAAIRRRLGDKARHLKTETTTHEALAAEHDPEPKRVPRRKPDREPAGGSITQPGPQPGHDPMPQPGPQPGRTSSSQLHSGAFDTLPEAQAALRRFTEAHYDSWPDQKIPALGGRTPREAVRDPDGREMVEALLLDFERKSARLGAGPAAFDFERLRDRLGLTTPTRRGPK